jgi:hypothetical protein
MQRRDLSKILLASSATSILGAESAQAQTCTAPCYVRTAAEITAGVTPTNLSYPPGDVRRYGADPTGSADSTTAIQSALNVNQAVYLPAGTYKTSAALTNGFDKRRIRGDGPKISLLQPTGAINTIVNTAACVLMSDFGILGSTATLDGITQSSSVTIYESRFENLDVWVGGRAFYFPQEFNTQLINCQGSSYNGNVFELEGGNSTLLQGCYAHQVPAGKYGYRIYVGAHLDSCTGIDSPTGGGDWGLFGAATVLGDAVDGDYHVVLTNCDVEDFNNTGIRLRNNGFAKIVGGAIIAPASGTYQAEVYIEYSNALVTIENVSFYQKGATRAKKAAIFGENGFTMMMIGPCTDPHADIAGVVYTIPVMKASYVGGLQRAINFNIADIGQLYSRYAGTAVLTGGSGTVTFAVPQPFTGYQVLVTGNVNEVFSVASKTVSGFTISSSNLASTASVDWMVIRKGT